MSSARVPKVELGQTPQEKALDPIQEESRKLRERRGVTVKDSAIRRPGK